MKVQQIELVNFKTFKDFKADFSGGIYLITGENELGKTTIIEAIATLLTGKRSANLLKQGTKEGFAKLHVGDKDSGYDVELRFSEKNPRGTFTITKQGSDLYTEKVTALQEIFDYQDFDAHEFVKWSESAEGRRKQVEVVKSLLPKSVQEEILNIDQSIEKIKESRKDVNSNIRVYEGFVKKSGYTLDDIKNCPEFIDVNILSARMGEIAEKNEQIKSIQMRFDSRKLELSTFKETTDISRKDLDNNIANVKEEAKQIEEDYLKKAEAIKGKLELMEIDRTKYLANRVVELEVLQDKQERAENWLLSNKVASSDSIKEQVKKAQETNERVSKIKEHEGNVKKLSELVMNKDGIEKDIEMRLSKRKSIIEVNKLPVDGLDFSDDGLTLNGVPFRPNEVSTSQEMEVAAKLMIAKNKTVKIFKIAQGESLGKKRFDAIVEFAKKAGYQGFIEEVRRGQDNLIIEEYTEN